MYPHHRTSVNAAFAIALTALLSAACDRTPSPPAATDPAPPRPPFVDATAALGLAFTHFNGMSGRLWFAETVGPGVEGKEGQTTFSY